MDSISLNVANFAGEKGFANFREICTSDNVRYFLVWHDNEKTEHDFFVKTYVWNEDQIELVEDVDGKIREMVLSAGRGDSLLKLNANAAKECVVMDRVKSSALADIGVIILIISIVGCGAILFTSVFEEVESGYHKETVLNGVALGAAIGCLISGLAVWALFKEISQISFTLKDIYSKMR